MKYISEQMIKFTELRCEVYLLRKYLRRGRGEILYDQATEIFGRIRKGDSGFIQQKLIPT